MAAIAAGTDTICILAPGLAGQRDLQAVSNPSSDRFLEAVRGLFESIAAILPTGNRFRHIPELDGESSVAVAHQHRGKGKASHDESILQVLKKSDFRLRTDFPGRPPRPVPPGPNHLAPHGYLLPVVITSGGQARSGEKGTWNVPKLDLIETLLRMFENRRLQICDTLDEAGTLRSELLSLRREGNTFEPYSERVHDDLLMSLALAAWRVTRHRKDFLWPGET